MENTAKNFALQLGSLITLYISIGALIGLLLGIITVQYPDQAQLPYEYDSATASIRFTIAMLIVFFPAYLVLTRYVNNIRRIESGAYLALTKWLIFLSLLVGGGVLLGDLVAILNSFLEGDLTIRFILKALTVLLVVGTAFTYYILDTRGYWQHNEKNSYYYAGVVLVAVCVSVITGFTHTETPSQIREMRLDEKQITDLQDMQYRIESYVALNGVLPYTLEDAYNNLEIPKAPEGRSVYSYKINSTDNFSLCAHFSTDSKKGRGYETAAMYDTPPLSIKNPNDWEHNSGSWCFDRAIAPQQKKLD